MFLIKILQIIIAILLIMVILLQHREGGMSGAIGGSSSGSVPMTKRGADKVFFIATIVLAVIFFGLSLLSLLI